MNNKNDVSKNASGYSDPTAAEAITHADESYDRFNKLLGIIFKLCEISGFHLESKIIVRDNKTGKILR